MQLNLHAKNAEQEQGEAVVLALNQEEQLLIITRLHKVSSYWGASCARVQQQVVGGRPPLYKKESRQDQMKLTECSGLPPT